MSARQRPLSLALRHSGAVVALALALVTIHAEQTVAVVLLGLAGAVVAAFATLQPAPTRLPALAVVLLAVQFLVATTGHVDAARVAATAGEACALWALLSCFSIRDVVAPETQLGAAAAGRFVELLLQVCLVAAPLAGVAVIAGD
ncbi:MAG TPA: hypothetical protein VMD59_21125, partial [Acidimicrobiales bacterium]|nr:hypothetical protein [Acidimicrobiales bacterium]